MMVLESNPEYKYTSIILYTQYDQKNNRPGYYAIRYFLIHTAGEDISIFTMPTNLKLGSEFLFCGLAKL